VWLCIERLIIIVATRATMQISGRFLDPVVGISRQAQHFLACCKRINYQLDDNYREFS
jgi:hypothetical protein